MKKLVLCILSAVLMLAACSDREPERKNLEYESPLSKFVDAYNKNDESTLLNCFTPGASDEFSQQGVKIGETLSANIESVIGDKGKLVYEVVDKTDLTDEEVDALSKEYTDKYSLRLEMKKASKLTVVFSTASAMGKSSATEPVEIITVKAGSSWYIYGEVITSLDLKTKE